MYFRDCKMRLLWEGKIFSVRKNKKVKNRQICYLTYQKEQKKYF